MSVFFATCKERKSVPAIFRDTVSHIVTQLGLRYCKNMKKNSSAVILCLCALSLFATAAQADSKNISQTHTKIGEVAKTRFTTAIEDLPLMKGLEIVEENDVLLIFGSNRIAQTTAKGWVDIDEVYYFYQETLPELGWTAVNAKTYLRDNERLLINASSANPDGMTHVTFEVEPY